MKFIQKQLVTLALAALIVSPAMAAEGLTKGGKFYQQRSNKAKTEQTANAVAPKTAEEAAKMAPAAGDQAEAAKPAKAKSFREEMRLPRKN